MKNHLGNNFFWLIILISVAISCYFYPTTRDDFYLFDVKANWNIFDIFWHNYITINPRLGQTLCVFFGQNRILHTILGGFLFVGFFVSLKKLLLRVDSSGTNILNVNLLIISAVLVGVPFFGHMFYYLPYSTNYTLSCIFYFFFIEKMLAYFIDSKGETLDGYPLLMIALVGLATGFCNEHVPPVLFLLFMIGGIYHFRKTSTFPKLKIMVLGLSLIIGYVLLYFAPANDVKMLATGKSEQFYSITNYISGWKKIILNYYYYEYPIVIVFFISILISIYDHKRGAKLPSFTKIKMAIIFIISILAISIAAWAPIVGYRLLFFSNILILLNFLVLSQRYFEVLSENVVIRSLIKVGLLVFFILGVLVTRHGNANFWKVWTDITAKSSLGKIVEIEKSFDYYHPYFGSFNRHYLLDTGTEYINNNEIVDTQQEKLLVKRLKIKLIKVKN